MPHDAGQGARNSVITRNYFVSAAIDAESVGCKDGASVSDQNGRSRTRRDVSDSLDASVVRIANRSSSTRHQSGERLRVCQHAEGRRRV